MVANLPLLRVTRQANKIPNYSIQTGVPTFDIIICSY